MKNCYRKSMNQKTIAMKKIYFILMSTLICFTAKSQVINGDFENVKENFLPSNWGKSFSMNVGLNTETGESTSDEIQYTSCIPGLCYSNFGNSNSGQYALEMANAFNITQNQIIVGGAVLFEDATQDFPPGGDYNSNTSQVPFNASLYDATYGYNLGFYYKFLSLGDDIAEANLELFDIDHNSVGKVSVPITGSNDIFEYVYAAVNLTSSNTPTFMSLSFSMAKEGSTPTLGSILIVDDVFINNATLSVNQNQINSFSVFPTLAKNEININKGNFLDNGIYNFKIFDSQGKMVKEEQLNFSNNTSKIKVDDLASGMYFLKSESNNFTTKFIKE